MLGAECCCWVLCKRQEDNGYADKSGIALSKPLARVQTATRPAAGHIQPATTAAPSSRHLPPPTVKEAGLTPIRTVTEASKPCSGHPTFRTIPQQQLVMPLYVRQHGRHCTGRVLVLPLQSVSCPTEWREVHCMQLYAVLPRSCPRPRIG